MHTLPNPPGVPWGLLDSPGDPLGSPTVPRGPLGPLGSSIFVFHGKSSESLRKSMPNRPIIDLRLSWASTAVSGTCPDALGTVFGHPRETGGASAFQIEPGSARAIDQTSSKNRSKIYEQTSKVGEDH